MLMKRGVLIISLLILFSSSVYAPTSDYISWPDGVPLGDSFHEILYTDEIDDASGDGNILISSNFDFGWFNITNVGIENVIITGDVDIDSDDMEFQGEMDFDGGIIVTENISVGGDIYSEGVIESGTQMNSPVYCNEDAESCYSTDNVTWILDTFCANCHWPTLFDILTQGGEFPDTPGPRDNANAINFFGTAIFGGKVNAPNLAAIQPDTTEVNYYLENFLGLSRIMQDTSGELHIQSQSGKISIENYPAAIIAEISLWATTTKALGNLEVSGNISVGGTVDGKDIAVNAAMLNENEIITSNWDNTQHPWTVDELDTDSVGNDELQDEIVITTLTVTDLVIEEEGSFVVDGSFEIDIDGTNCDEEEYAQGIDESGNAEGCGGNTNGNAATATALASDPTDCSNSGYFAYEIDAEGDLTCSADLTDDSVSLDELSDLCIDGQILSKSGEEWICVTDFGGTADTADELSDNGANCATGTFPAGIDASGDVEDCQADINGNSGTVTDGVYTAGDQTIAGSKTFSSTIVGNINTATALSADGTNCETGEYAQGVDASGNAEGCATDSTSVGCSGCLGVGTEVSTTFAGNVVNTGFTFTALEYLYDSDKRLKKNVKVMDGALDKILQLEGVSFIWKKDNEKGIGFIAQDLEKVFPGLVSTNEKTGLKAISYGKLVAPLVESIKEQQKEIDELKEELKELRDSIERLKR